MEITTKFKIIVTTAFAFVSAIFGALTVPILLMVACNVIDYVTGLAASPYRKQDINSYKSMRGIIRKISMWLLVVVGAIIDQLILYAGGTMGIEVGLNWMVACIVAIWIICNEIISILENLKDIGVKLPSFLMPLVKHIKSQVEDKTGANEEEGE